MTHQLTVQSARTFLFNDLFNTFYLRLYGVRHVVKDHKDSEKENPATLFDKQQGIFYIHYPTDSIVHTMAYVKPIVERWMERKITEWVHHEESIRRLNAHFDQKALVVKTALRGCGIDELSHAPCYLDRSRVTSTSFRGKRFEDDNELITAGARCSSVVQWVVGSILYVVDPLSYFSFQPVLHDWCNKGRGMCYPVCGMMHIKEPLLLIGKSSPCGGSGFPLSLSELSFTICMTPYNRK